MAIFLNEVKYIVTIVIIIFFDGFDNSWMIIDFFNKVILLLFW
jgi:hypothetical protein